MLRIEPGRLEGQIAAPASKSHTHRAFILGALSGNGSIARPLASRDTQETLDGLQTLGFMVASYPHEVRIGGILKPPRGVVVVRESGTTLRLLSGIASLLSQDVRLVAGPRLRERPMQPLVKALQDLGVHVQPTTEGWTFRGPIKGGTTTIDADVSSQFVSALLLACPLARTDTHVRLQGALASRPYVDITLALMRHHGLRIRVEPEGFMVPAAQTVRQKPYTVPGDYSSAAFLMAGAAITGGPVVVTNLPSDDPQGDRAIVELLRAFGADVRATASDMTVSATSPLRAADVDIGATPDLFPILCSVAAVARGTSQIRGAPQLRHKESDRIHAMAANLRAAGIAVEEHPDGIQVTGGSPQGTTIQSFNDHRVAMAMAVLALKSRGASILPDENVVAKSYPSFHNDLQSLAAQVARP